MNGAFNGQILAEKLSKLNNSQQSIETLSHWCIFHRKKAKQVVETWDRQFHSAPREQRIPFLYLANDILQNSRRKGSEFVGEFWKVLPGALSDVFEKGDEHGRNAAMRLVDIWEERKVFGSRGQILKEEMVGRNPHVSLENTNNGRSLHSTKVKLAVGGTLEKIVSAYESVHDRHLEEDAVLVKCKAAASYVEKMEKDVDNGCNFGDMQESNMVEELREKDSLLRQCIEQLESSEMVRAALVSHLREVLQQEESMLEEVRTQLQGDVGKHWYDRYWAKAQLWIMIFSYVGNYFWTHYFFTVLGASYTFPSWRMNNVPHTTFLLAHACFLFYHITSNITLRRLRNAISELPSFIQFVVQAFWIFALSYFIAFLETFAIANFPYYDFVDRAAMYKVGSLFYAIYFLVSFPMFIRLDEKPNDPWNLSRTSIDALGAAMLVTIMLDLWRLFLGPIVEIPKSIPYKECLSYGLPWMS